MILHQAAEEALVALRDIETEAVVARYAASLEEARDALISDGVRFGVSAVAW